jgi:hypothetical protein
MRRSPPLVIAVLPLRSTQFQVAALAACLWAGLAWRFLPWALFALPLPVAWAWRVARVAERRLRWDGERWWLSAAVGNAEVGVQMRVVIDLGDWLLLRATPDGQRFAIRHRFLPLNRAGQGAIWGALRATLVSARAQ